MCQSRRRRAGASSCGSSPPRFSVASSRIGGRSRGDRPPRYLAFLLPLLGTTFGIFLILALSFNIEYGYAGQPNLGKVFFYSIGGYVAGALTTHALWALAGSPADVPFLEDAGGAGRVGGARGGPARARR